MQSCINKALHESNLMIFSRIKKVKEMAFKAGLGDLEQNIFHVTQPCWAPFKINFPVFVRRTHESFLEIESNPVAETIRPAKQWFTKISQLLIFSNPSSATDLMVSPLSPIFSMHQQCTGKLYKTC